MEMMDRKKLFCGFLAIVCTVALGWLIYDNAQAPQFAKMGATKPVAVNTPNGPITFETQEVTFQGPEGPVTTVVPAGSKFPEDAQITEYREFTFQGKDGPVKERLPVVTWNPKP